MNKCKRLSPLFCLIFIFTLSILSNGQQWGGVDLNDPKALDKIINEKLEYEHKNYNYYNTIISNLKNIAEMGVENAISTNSVNTKDFNRKVESIERNENLISSKIALLDSLEPESQESQMIQGEIDELFESIEEVKARIKELIYLNSLYRKEFLDPDEKQKIELFREKFSWEKMTIKRAAEHALCLVPDEFRKISIDSLKENIEKKLKEGNQTLVTRQILFDALNATFPNIFGKQLLEYLDVRVGKY